MFNSPRESLQGLHLLNLSNGEAFGAIGVVSSLITLADVAWRAGKRIREYSDQAEDVPKLVRNIDKQLGILHETISQWRDQTVEGAIVIHDSAGLDSAILGCSEAVDSLVPLIEQIPKEERIEDSAS
jgi:hypothetical protein